MQSRETFPGHYRQHEQLPLRLVSPAFGHLAPEQAGQNPARHRTPYYFLLFMVDGQTQHGADLQPFDIQNNELFFVLPHQLHQR